MKIITNNPIALESPDHIQPWGTARDNSRNFWFNKKLFCLISGKLNILDLGCSGGGFIKSVIDSGHFGIGIEGSDYSFKNKRAEWRTISDNLFTADISEPFQLMDIDEKCNEIKVKFNVITLWEVIEHISENKLPILFQNINNHLEINGIVIMSVSTKEDIINGVRLHQTVKSKDWWINKFLELGFKNNEIIIKYFYYDWVRGIGIDDEASFNVVLNRVGDKFIYPNRLIFLSFVFWPLDIIKFIFKNINDILIRVLSIKNFIKRFL